MKSALETAEAFTQLAWRDKDPEGFARVMRENTQIIDSRVGFANGVQSLQNTITDWHRAFPDLQYIETNTAQNSDGSITKSWKVHATHLGPCYQLTATGNPVHYEGETTFSFDGEHRIQVYHANVNIDAILAQITPSPSASTRKTINDFTPHLNRIVGDRLTDLDYTLIALSMFHLSGDQVSELMTRSSSGTKRAKTRIIEKLRLHNWPQVISHMYRCNIDSVLTKVGNEMIAEHYKKSSKISVRSGILPGK